MSAWRVIDCSATSGALRAARGQLVVEVEDQSQSVPIPVQEVSVLLVGPRMRFSTGSMHRALDAGVAVLFTDWRGVPEGGAYGWSTHTRVGARQLAQTSVSLPRRKNAWGRIVRAKVLGQAQNLSERSPQVAQRLAGLAQQVRSGDPSNVEAQAARLYWAALFDEPFIREPRAGVGWNSCLDYGYGILRGFGIRAVLAAGLLPGLGIFHRGRSNAFNLVDDLLEPYRPAIDDAVVQMPSDSCVEDSAIKRELVAAATQRFEADGTGIGASMLGLAQQLGRYYEGDIPRLTVPHWQGSRDQGAERGEDPEW